MKPFNKNESYIKIDTCGRQYSKYSKRLENFSFYWDEKKKH